MLDDQPRLVLGQPSISQTNENTMILMDHHQAIWETCWYDWCGMELLPTNFDQGIVNELSCSKMCAFLAHRKSRAVMTECVSWTQRTVGS